MILVDTSVIVAWLDQNHPQHPACAKIIEHWARRDRLVHAVILPARPPDTVRHRPGSSRGGARCDYGAAGCSERLRKAGWPCR